MHPIVFSSIFKSQVMHKRSPFFLCDHRAFYIGLFNEDTKLIILIPPKSYDAHVRTRKNGIVDYYPIQRQTKYIIMLESNELVNQPMSGIKKDRAFCAKIIGLGN